jgi:hypothetical protein
LLAFYEIIYDELFANGKPIKRGGEDGCGRPGVYLHHSSITLSLKAVLEQADHILRGRALVLQEGDAGASVRFSHRDRVTVQRDGKTLSVWLNVEDLLDAAGNNVARAAMAWESGTIESAAHKPRFVTASHRDDLKLARFRGVLDVSVDYGSVLTTSLMASYAIGER